MKLLAMADLYQLVEEIKISMSMLFKQKTLFCE